MPNLESASLLPIHTGAAAMLKNAFISSNAMIAGDPTLSDEFEFTGPHTLKAMTWEAVGSDKQVAVIVDLADAVAKPLPPPRK
jgi:hypothetical protein